MSGYAFGNETDVAEPTFDSEGGVIGTTTESSRHNNSVAEDIEGKIQPTLRHGYSETVDLDTQHEYTY